MDKICLVTSACDSSTGGGGHVLALATGLHNHGKNVTVVCMSDGTLMSSLHECGVKCICITMKSIWDWSCFIRMRAFLSSDKPIIVHTHGERATFLANWCAKSMGIPIIVATIHRSIERTTGWGRIQRKIFSVLEGIVLKGATTHIIAVSEAMKSEILSNRGLESGIVTVVHHGVAMPSVDMKERLKRQAQKLRSSLGIGNSTWVVGSVGRLSPEKNYEFLVKVASCLIESCDDDIVFIVAGDGPQRGELESLVESLSLSNKFFFVGHKDPIAEWIAMFDVFVLPSQWESFGLVLAETMALGIPVIATDQSAPKEFICSGETGILMPMNNPQMLSSTIVSLLHNLNLRSHIEVTAILTIKNQISIGNMLDNTINLYNRLIFDMKHGMK